MTEKSSGWVCWECQGAGSSEDGWPCSVCGGTAVIPVDGLPKGTLVRRTEDGDDLDHAHTSADYDAYVKVGDVGRIVRHIRREWDEYLGECYFVERVQNGYAANYWAVECFEVVDGSDQTDLLVRSVHRSVEGLRKLLDQ